MDISLDIEHEDENDDNKHDDCVDDSENKNSDLDSNKCDINEQDHFTVEITRDEWNKIKSPEPLIYNGRKYIGFKPNVWSNQVSYAF